MSQSNGNGIERLVVDVASAIRDGLLAPGDFAGVDALLTQLETVRRGGGRASVARLEATAEVVRDVVSGRGGDRVGRVDAVFQQLASSLGLRRALFSTVGRGVWRPASLFVEGALRDTQAGLRDYLMGSPIDLRDAPLEDRTIRDRRPVLVTSPKTHSMTYKPLMAVSDSRGYVIAPVVSNGAVVGMVHADHFDRPATDLDLERVEFAAGVVRLSAERLHGRRRLAELAQRLNGVVAYAEEVAGGRAELDAVCRPAVPARTAAPLLTAKQQLILRRLSVGATNTAIAQELGLAEATVKSHVKQIYSRLGVHSRAAAAAVYRANLDVPPTDEE